MKEIFEAVFGLLIAPEPEDPLDSVLAEEFLSSREKYEENAQQNTAQAAVTTPYGDVYERQAIEEELEKQKVDPFNEKPLEAKDLTPNQEMKKMVRKHRESQIQTYV
ncbi:hypothetical protein JZ751_013450 [Albula glossodonta]|uniref:U-box domain-containing protein n=1 Tax=Albula glossodonta TaxID=121402 RepID=A0A8T2N642_9TELE|nr:hypothetical protein JZ751_013450 [Albula glossodonta]